MILTSVRKSPIKSNPSRYNPLEYRSFEINSQARNCLAVGVKAWALAPWWRLAKRLPILGRRRTEPTTLKFIIKILRSPWLVTSFKKGWTATLGFHRFQYSWSSDSEVFELKNSMPTPEKKWRGLATTSVFADLTSAINFSSESHSQVVTANSG